MKYAFGFFLFCAFAAFGVFLSLDTSQRDLGCDRDVRQRRRADNPEKLRGLSSAGEVAPMSFTNYKEVRPWAKAIREKVVTREMPPWFADSAHGEFSNDPRLSQKEIDAIVAWVEGGAKEGDPRICRRLRNTPRAGRSANLTSCSRCPSNTACPPKA